MLRLRGDEMEMLINGTAISCERGYTVNIQVDTVPVVSETSNRGKDYKVTLYGWELTANYVYAKFPDNFETVFDHLMTFASVPIRFQSKALDSPAFSGSGIIVGLDHDAQVKNSAGFNLRILGTGELVKENFNLIDELNDNLIDESNDNLIS